MRVIIINIFFKLILHMGLSFFSNWIMETRN